MLTNGPDSSAEQESRSEDIFDKLVGAKRASESPAGDRPVATDDAIGPAIHAPYRPTPLPPRTSSIPLPPGIARPATLLRAPEEVFATPIPTPVNVAANVAANMTATTPSSAPLATLLPPPAPALLSVNATQPLAALSIPPAARTAPILILDEDAFYHPAGRIRTLADVTIDGYRPEPTLMVRLRERRHALKWVVAAIVASLALFAIFAVAVGFGRATADRPAPVSAEKPVATEPAKAATAPIATTPIATAPTATATATAAPAATPEAAPTATAPEVPVFDVNSLKSAPPIKPRR